MFGLGTILSTKSLLKLIALEIEKQLFVDVEKFDLIYEAKENKLTFRVGTDLFAFDDSTITATIKQMAEGEIQNGDTLDVVIAHFDSTTNIKDYADIYFTDKSGEKASIKFNY